MNKRLISTVEIKTRQVMSVEKCRTWPTTHLMKNVCDTTPMQIQRHAFISNCMYVVSMYICLLYIKDLGKRQTLLPIPKFHTCIKIAKSLKISAKPLLKTQLLVLSLLKR